MAQRVAPRSSKSRSLLRVTIIIIILLLRPAYRLLFHYLPAVAPLLLQVSQLHDEKEAQSNELDSVQSLVRKMQVEHHTVVDTLQADMAVALGKAQSRALDERSEWTAQEAELQVGVRAWV